MTNINITTYINKNDENFIIICDNREEIATQNTKIIESFYKVNTNLKIPIKIIIKQLKLGDYKCKDLIFERKTIADLIVSIRSGDRLLDQFRRLNLLITNNSQVQCFLCIIGNIDFEIKSYLKKRSKKTISFDREYNRIKKSINAILAKFNIYGICALTFETIDDFTYFILKCIQYRYIKNPENRIPQKYKVIINDDKKINEKVSITMLKGIPGIGDKTARKLLNKFGNIVNIANASLEEIQEVTAPMSQKPSEQKKNIETAKIIYNSFRNKFGVK